MSNPNISEEGKLYRWQPGESGNPGGRRKTFPLGERYRAVLEMPAPDKVRKRLEGVLGKPLPEGFTFGDAIVLANVLSAAGVHTGADIGSAREIREAVEGQLVQVASAEQPEDRQSIRTRLMAGLLDMMVDRCNTYGMAMPQLKELAAEAGIELDLPEEDESKGGKA